MRGSLNDCIAACSAQRWEIDPVRVEACLPDGLPSTNERTNERTNDTTMAMKVATATLRLSRDFTVGLTSDMPGFFALVAMKLRWPLNRLCCIARNVNAKTGGQKSKKGRAGVQILQTTHCNEIGLILDSIVNANQMMLLALATNERTNK